MGRNLKLNTIFPIIQQLCTVLKGFLIPKLLILYFGSETNGLVQSISQFITMISFAEVGVGSVVRFNLYRPLANKDGEEINKIMSSSNKFFSNVGKMLFIYLLVLMIFYPISIKSTSFGYFSTSVLIFSIGLSSLAQYFFGQSNYILLTADQKNYIVSIFDIATILLNIFCSMFLIKMGFSIQIVKLVTSFIFMIKPLAIKIYVNKNYNINLKTKYEKEPISQKWNGISQHISAVVIESTDSIVLTLFSNLVNVSIYSIYNMVIYGLKTLIVSSTSGIQSYIGNIIACEDRNKFRDFFEISEWIIDNVGLFIFGCTSVLIIPFVQVYTKGITDVDYLNKSFAFLITFCNLLHTLRLPYHICIQSGGYYKETEKYYLVSAILNVSSSIIFVSKFGLVGVAIGTMLGMGYQMLMMSYFCYVNILKMNYTIFIKKLIMNIFIYVLIIFFCITFVLSDITYSAWIIMAIKTGIISLSIILIINILFNREIIKKIF